MTPSILDDLARDNPVRAEHLGPTWDTPDAQCLLTDILSQSRAKPVFRGRPPSREGRRSSHRIAAVVGVAATVVALGMSVLVVGTGSGTTTRRTTPWQAGQVLRRHGHVRSGHWQLVDDQLSGTWQQNTYGPPPGPGSCPTASTCYVMAGQYASASAGEPESESLYASTDVGATWTVLPMPSGFIATTNLSCATATACAAGGTYQGQPVLVVTTDGGHSFVINPLPAGVGTLYDVSCPTASFCGGLVATTTWKGLPHNIPIHATFLSTSDAGHTFVGAPFLTGDSMQTLVCSSTADCTAIGDQLTNASGAPGLSVVAITTDSGRTWTQGAFPNGFRVSPSRTLTCPDATHCSVAGWIPKTTWKPTNATPTPTIEVVATTVNGGLTWSEQPSPANVPRLGISSLSCPTDNECWVAGMYRPEHETPVLLGTTNDGATWSIVTFSAPAGAPNFDHQSYISMGQIDCPTANVCVARGAVAQGSLSAPVYSLVEPSS